MLFFLCVAALAAQPPKMTTGISGPTYARELHVSLKGSDSNDGSALRPYRTISAAAAVAQPGDVITVHEGTYRERVTPPRGGESDSKRIVYQAGPGERVAIKGSEVIRNWKHSWRVCGRRQCRTRFSAATIPTKT